MSDVTLTVQTQIAADIQIVWNAWTSPEHITQWNFASDEWCCPSATNDAQPGGAFSWRMEAKDGSMGFDYEGAYDRVEKPSRIEKTLSDGRKVSVQFSEVEGGTTIIEEFEADAEHAEMQKQGWQAILENFKAHVEGLKS